MQVVHEVCCGLDVHKKSVTACVLWASGRRRETRAFGTFTRELLELGDWLRACGVTHVAMESTGVYWKPVWNLLEGQFEVLLVNAQHIKAVPGRKTDQKDSEWIADLLQHGLLRASFVPPTPIRELRDLTRYRASLAQEVNRIANRIQKVLEDANIKLASVATDTLGASGRAMLEAIIQGEQDSHRLAEMSRGLLRNKIPELQQALQGRVTPHHRFLLRELLDHLYFVQSKMQRIEQEVAERLGPFQSEVARLCTMNEAQPRPCRGGACLPCKGPAWAVRWWRKSRVRRIGLSVSPGACWILPGQPSADLSVIVSKRKMFSAVIIVMAPKEREWNL